MSTDSYVDAVSPVSVKYVELERHLHESVGAHAVPDDRALAEVGEVEHDEIGSSGAACRRALLRARDRLAQRRCRFVREAVAATGSPSSPCAGTRRVLALDEELGQPHRGAPVEAGVLHAEARDCRFAPR